MNTTLAGSPVERAGKTARPVQKDALSQVLAIAENAREEIENLLPIEKGQVNKLRDIANRNACHAKVLSAMGTIGEEYAQFPTESLGWRDEKGMPGLVPFLITQDTATFHSMGFVDKSIPESVQPFYRDVNQMLADAVDKHNNPINEREDKRFRNIVFSLFGSIALILLFIPPTVLGVGAKTLIGLGGAIVSLLVAVFFADTFTHTRVKAYQIKAKFDGLIPEKIRKKIRKAQSLGVFSEVFILAEVPDLKIEEGSIPRLARVGDPLVIGYDGLGFWLIAQFDTSPAEALALSGMPSVS